MSRIRVCVNSARLRENGVTKLCILPFREAAKAIHQLKLWLNFLCHGLKSEAFVHPAKPVAGNRFILHTSPAIAVALKLRI